MTLTGRRSQVEVRPPVENKNQAVLTSILQMQECTFSWPSDTYPRVEACDVGEIGSHRNGGLLTSFGRLKIKLKADDNLLPLTLHPPPTTSMRDDALRLFQSTS